MEEWKMIPLLCRIDKASRAGLVQAFSLGHFRQKSRSPAAPAVAPANARLGRRNYPKLLEAVLKFNDTHAQADPDRVSPHASNPAGAIATRFCGASAPAI